MIKVTFAVINYDGYGFRFKKEIENYNGAVPRVGETLIISDFSFKISRVEWYIDKNECWIICD